MRIKDFPHIFNDMEFPIRWKAEYIRLLTTFEVAVELGDDQLLIPSALSHHRPNLPQVGVPQGMVSTLSLSLSLSLFLPLSLSPSLFPSPFLSLSLSLSLSPISLSPSFSFPPSLPPSLPPPSHSLCGALQKQLPPLRHAYIVPFIPNGFWPRLMSRLITDNSITELAREGCAIPLTG